MIRTAFNSPLDIELCTCGEGVDAEAALPAGAGARLPVNSAGEVAGCCGCGLSCSCENGVTLMLSGGRGRAVVEAAAAGARLLGNCGRTLLVSTEKGVTVLVAGRGLGVTKLGRGVPRVCSPRPRSVVT